MLAEGKSFGPAGGAFARGGPIIFCNYRDRVENLFSLEA